MTDFRAATPADAARIADLHADSWRRHYRGAYANADAFLDGDVAADRHTLWSARLATPASSSAPASSGNIMSSGGPASRSGPVPSATVLAERDGGLIGFVHVVFDHDPRWGSLVDNLHVTNDLRRTGVGSLLLARAAAAVAEQATDSGLYLWVLEQNVAAQQFYRRCGAIRVETALVGGPSRLNGTPRKHRMAWPDIARLS